MTISLNLANIANSIAAISIFGVTVKDKDEIVANWTSLPNVLYPKPDGWITEFSLEYDTVLRGTNAPITVIYTLNYRFLGVQSGDLSIFPIAYSSLIDKLILIINAMMAVDSPYSGKVEMELAGPVNIGPLSDPTGNMFFGADIALNIREMQN